MALLLGVFFQGQAQQRSDMADVRAELCSGFSAVNVRFGEVDRRFAEVNTRLDRISDDLAEVRERVASIEGRLADVRERVAGIETRMASSVGAATQANAATRKSEAG